MDLDGHLHWTGDAPRWEETKRLFFASQRIRMFQSDTFWYGLPLSGGAKRITASKL